MTSSVDTGATWVMSQPCTARVVLGTPQCVPAAAQRFEKSSSHWVFVFSSLFFAKLSIFCESRESFGMHLVRHGLSFPEQRLNCPTCYGRANGYTAGTPPHTRVVIRMGLGYNAKDGPAIKARRPKPRSVLQALHFPYGGSGVCSPLHQRGRRFIQANRFMNVPAVRRAHSVRPIAQRQRPSHVVDDAITPGT